jgi:hypothetical protein
MKQEDTEPKEQKYKGCPVCNYKGNLTFWAVINKRKCLEMSDSDNGIGYGIPCICELGQHMQSKSGEKDFYTDIKFSKTLQLDVFNRIQTEHLKREAIKNELEINEEFRQQQQEFNHYFFNKLKDKLGMSDLKQKFTV